jgi:hypothetical protein
VKFCHTPHLSPSSLVEIIFKLFNFLKPNLKILTEHRKILRNDLDFFLILIYLLSLNKSKLKKNSRSLCSVQIFKFGFKKLKSLKIISTRELGEGGGGMAKLHITSIAPSSLHGYLVLESSH